MTAARRKSLLSSAAPALLASCNAARAKPSLSARTPVRHFTLPAHEVGRLDFREGETLNAFVKRSGWAQRGDAGWRFRLPTICVVNGLPVLQKAWRRTRLRADDVVEFWSRPLGGAGRGGKNLFGLIGVIALSIFAPWAGGALAGALSLGALGTSVLTGAITVAGGLLISALTRPSTSGQGSQTEQLYSVSASGNTARLLQPITAHYGRLKSFPDFAIAPWSEFDGNDQYLNVLLSQGLGKFAYDLLYLDDTIMWTAEDGVDPAFPDVSVAFYEPGEQVALFPVNVTQADTVSGQEVTTTYVGGFPASGPATLAKQIACDFVFPAGCYSLDGDGRKQNSSVELTIQSRPIDDAGAPITPTWTTIFSETKTYRSSNPIRFTVKSTVSPGRFEIRVKRTTAAISNSSNGVNTLSWVGLRAFIDGPATFPVSTVAIRIKANGRLSQSTANKFGTVATRILPVWDTGTETWIEQPTRSPLWAFWDAATNSDYGAGRPPSKVDFQGIFDAAAAAEARGDTFDYRFTAGTAVPDVFDTILKSTRSRHRWSGDILTVVRDEWTDTPRMLLTDREIVRGSLSLTYALNTDDAADAVLIDYLDENTWSQAQVQYPPNSESFTSTKPSQLKLDGVVNRDQVYREAAFYYRQSQLRRVQIALDTEHDGRMLGFGSRVRVQTELPQTWGATGAVTALNVRTLTLDPAPAWAPSGNHYIAVRTKTGRQFGPVLCTRGADDSLAVLDATDLSAVQTVQGMTIAAALDRADGADAPSFDFGVGEKRARMCVVLSGRPNGDKVTLGLVADNEAVHADDLGTTPAPPAVPALRDPTAPVITVLQANFRQGVMEPVLDATWPPAAGATYYSAEVSYDNGASWTPVYEGQRAGFSAVVDYASLTLRVQGVGQRRGAWYAVDVDPPTIRLANGVVDLDSLTAEIRAILDRAADQAPLLSILADLDTLSGAMASQVASIKENLGQVLNAVGARYGENKALAEIAISAAATANSALAQLFSQVFAATDTGQSQALMRFVAVAGEDGVAASIQFQVRGQVGDEWSQAGLTLQAGVTAIGGGSQIVLDATSIILKDSNGVQSPFDALLLTVGDGITSVPIVSGTVTPDLTDRREIYATLATAGFQLNFPTGARIGRSWKHEITQDPTGGRAVTFGTGIINPAGGSIDTRANYTTLVDGYIRSVDPPIAVLTGFQAVAYGVQDWAYVGRYGVNSRGFRPVTDAGGAADDLMVVLSMWTGQSSPMQLFPAATLPGGWTQAHLRYGYQRTTDASANYIYSQCYISAAFRRLDGSETGTVNFFGSPGTGYSNGFRTEVYRFTGGLTPQVIQKKDSFGYNASPSISLNLSAEQSRLIAFAAGCSLMSFGSAPTFPTFTAYDRQDSSFTDPIGSRTGFKIYNSAPADESISLQNKGNANCLLGFALKI